MRLTWRCTCTTRRRMSMSSTVRANASPCLDPRPRPASTSARYHAGIVACTASTRAAPGAGVVELPEVGLPRVLAWVDPIWSPEAAPHHIVYGRTGVGNTTLVPLLTMRLPRLRYPSSDTRLILSPAQP